MVQYHIGIHIPPQLYTDAHTFPVRLVTEFRNAVNPLIPHQVGNFFNQPCFVHHIGQFCHNNPAFSICHGLNICDSPHLDFSTACAVGFFDSPGSQNRSSSGKIRPFYHFQNFFQFCISIIFYDVINNPHNCMNDLPEIMWRDICSHSHSNAGSTIYQKIGITGRKYNRLPFCLIKVGCKVHRILIDVRQHLHGYFAETCLCIPHGRRTVPIHGPKIPMSIHERVPG